MCRLSCLLLLSMLVTPLGGCDGDDGTDGYQTGDSVIRIPVDLDIVDGDTPASDTSDADGLATDADAGPGLETLPCESDDECAPTYACHESGACDDGICVFSWLYDDGMDCTLDCVIENGSATQVTHVLEGCAMESKCWEEGDENPENLCEICEHERVSTNWSPREDGYTCDDADPCTVAETACLSGICTGPSIFDDGNECTHDCIIDVNSQAVPISENVAELSACDDGNPCTEADYCSSGLCIGGDPPDCEDEDPCTDDSCDPDVGCVHPPLDCDDAIACTDDSCDTLFGFCLNIPSESLGCNSCEGLCSTFTPDNGLVCSCDIACPEYGDCCGDFSLFCPDLAPCLVDTDCDDDDDCTLDTCDPTSGCVSTPTPDCGNTSDSCLGLCDTFSPDNGLDCSCDFACDLVGDCCDDYEETCASAPECSEDSDCDDGSSCTFDICDDECLHLPDDFLCDDEDPCTDDVCNTFIGCTHSAIDCDDDNACTSDICDPELGCQNEAVTDDTPCEDGDACTENDACTGGACGGSPFDCDDNNGETEDSCVDGECLHIAQ